ncbi:hypothetical protein OAF99_02420 [Akkermansiaceae bacterium]|nr:hypothetical protein [Akkermansiaceae bacterium]
MDLTNKIKSLLEKEADVQRKQRAAQGNRLELAMLHRREADIRLERMALQRERAKSIESFLEKGGLFR